MDYISQGKILLGGDYMKQKDNFFDDEIKKKY